MEGANQLEYVPWQLDYQVVRDVNLALLQDELVIQRG